MQNKTRIIVCTNAFGMGIDKHDVNFVVHIDLPDSIEAYFQEAGRAGRDEKKAFCILLYNHSDKAELERNANDSFPSIEEIKKTYQALANYYQLATGSGLGLTFNFDIAAFCDTYKLQAITVFNCLKFIEREGYISTTEALHQPSRIKIELNRDDLYKFQIASPTYDGFIKLVLRSYSGLFDNFVKISELDLANKLNTSREDIVKKTGYLQQHKLLTYIPQTESAQLTFEKERVETKKLFLSKENFTTLKERVLERIKAVINYSESTRKCRSQILLAYFGETNTTRCNQCDVCLEENKKTLHSDEFDIISKQIKELLAVHPMQLAKLVNALTEGNEYKRIRTIQWLIDNGQLKYNGEELLVLND